MTSRLQLISVLCAATLAWSCSSATKGTIGGSGRTVLYGYVLRAERADTVAAANAKVWTDPPSNVVNTDSTGYWEISEGLVPGTYRVMAEADGVTGRTQRITTKLGGSDKVVVFLGAEETAWPPLTRLEDKTPKGTVGPGGRPRCCAP